MSSRSGLSLFELLIALALLALLSVGLSQALRFAVEIYDRARLDPLVSEQIAAKSRLRAWLTNAVSPSSLAPFPVTFVGEENRIEFTTTYGKGFSRNAAALRIAVESSDDDLIATVSAMDDDGSILSTHSILIAADIVPDFQYYQVDTEDSNWYSVWENGSHLPALIAIHSRSKDLNLWPTFVVKPAFN